MLVNTSNHSDAKTCSDALPAKKVENSGHLPRDGLPRREDVPNIKFDVCESRELGLS